MHELVLESQNGLIVFIKNRSSVPADPLSHSHDERFMGLIQNAISTYGCSLFRDILSKFQYNYMKNTFIENVAQYTDKLMFFKYFFICGVFIISNHLLDFFNYFFLYSYTYTKLKLIIRATNWLIDYINILLRKCSCFFFVQSFIYNTILRYALFK